MRIRLTLLLIIAVFYSLKADTLTLKQCYTLAEQNYPNIKQRELFDKQTALRLKNLSTQYFPQASVTMQASYQSDVATFPAQFEKVINVKLPKDHEQGMIDINQTIYDGGNVKSGKQLERAQHEVNLQNIEVDLYSVRGKVNTYFFTSLILRQSHAILDSNAKLLQARIDQVNSGYKSGSALESDLLKLKAQLLTVEQSIEENESNVKTVCDALTVLTGKAITPGTYFQPPSESGELGQLAKERPELKLFQLQKQQVSVADKQVMVVNIPKLSAFIEGGFSHPNLFNFLDNNTKPYYLLGGKLSWNLTGWYTTKRQREVNNLQRQIVDVQKDNFQRNLDLAAANDNAEMQRITKLINRDDAIIDTYSHILKLSTSQLQNGTITVADYLIDLNAESLARLNKQIHKVQLEQAQVNYITNQGKTFSNESK